MPSATSAAGHRSMAIAAVDVALWDLKARLLDLPLVTLLGAVRDAVPVYGSGGFTSYSDRPAPGRSSAAGSAQGIPRVKMKIGTHPADDLARVAPPARRSARTPSCSWTRTAPTAASRRSPGRARSRARRELVRGAGLLRRPRGLRLIRDRGPAGMDIAAGEYGYDCWYFRRMLEAGAVDVLQADAIALRAGSPDSCRVGRAVPRRAAWRSRPTARRRCTSHACCALPLLRHLEYFHDHVRIEHMLFDGALTPVEGALRPDGPGRAWAWSSSARTRRPLPSEHRTDRRDERMTHR